MKHKNFPVPVSDIGMDDDAPVPYTSPKRRASSVKPLARAGSSDFTALFTEMCEEIAKVCDFSGEWQVSADVGAKTGMLREIERVLSACPEKMNARCWKALFDAIRSNLENRRLLGEKFQEGADLSWPHVGLVYELLRAIVSVVGEDEEEMLWSMLYVLILNSTSFDARERKAVVQILHLIYQRYVSMRYTIRVEMYSVMIEGQCSNELLEFLGALVPGFAEPLKEEHVKFFYDAVLHLLSCETILESLPGVIVKYVNKDQTLYPAVISYTLTHFPVTNPKKQVFIISVLRYFFSKFPDMTGSDMIESVLQVLGDVIVADHSDASLTAIDFIQDDVILDLISASPTCVTGVLSAVETASVKHWCSGVRKNCSSLLRILHQMTEGLPKIHKAMNTKTTSETKWKKVLAMARKRDRHLQYTNI